jgi:predicted secreted Zn-dependent protease
MEGSQITAIVLTSLICGTIAIGAIAQIGALILRRGATLSCGLAIAAACATTPPVDVGQLPPDVDVVLSTRFYAVSAATVKELREEMRPVGPSADGRKWAGATQARTRWTFGHLRRGMVCMLHNVRVVVTAEIRLPRWQPVAPPDSATQAWWNDFSARLLEHERGHVRIAVDGAREIAEALRPLEGSVSCDGLTMRANGEAQLILVRTRERQAEYDRITGHGGQEPTGSATTG